MNEITHLIDDFIFNLKLDKFEQHKLVQNISQKSKIASKQLLRGVIGFLGAVTLFWTFIFAHNLVYFLLSVMYPAFLTAKAINNSTAFEKNGKLYLSYWVTFSFLTAFNQLFGFVLRHIPFSKFLQCLFTIWLYNHKSRGAEFLNHIFLQPLFKSKSEGSEKSLKEDLKGEANKAKEQAKETYRETTGQEKGYKNE